MWLDSIGNMGLESQIAQILTNCGQTVAFVLQVMSNPSSPNSLPSYFISGVTKYCLTSFSASEPGVLILCNLFPNSQLCAEFKWRYFLLHLAVDQWPQFLTRWSSPHDMAAGSPRASDPRGNTEATIFFML